MESRPIRPDERFVQARDALARRTRRSVVVLGSRARHPVVLRGTSKLVWDALERARTLDDVARDLAGRFVVEADDVHADVVPFVAELLDAGVVERSRA